MHSEPIYGEGWYIYVDALNGLRLHLGTKSTTSFGFALYRLNGGDIVVDAGPTWVTTQTCRFESDDEHGRANYKMYCIYLSEIVGETL